MGRNGEELTIRALCDNGSQVNLITLSAVEKINEKLQVGHTAFCGVGGKEIGTSLGEVWVSIKLSEKTSVSSKFYVVKKITNYCPPEEPQTNGTV